MISYVEAVIKSIEGLKQVVTYAPYKSEYLQRRSVEFEKELLWFRSKVTVELGFDLKTFCICNTQLRLLRAKIWLFFGPIW